MTGCTADGGWGVALIDAARARLAEIEDRLTASRVRAARIVDDTDWRASAVHAYRARAAAWEYDVRDVAHEVARVRADLRATRRDLLARSLWECG